MTSPRRCADGLALLGGAALGAGLAQPCWPPRDEETARDLTELYWRGNWSFDLDGQEAAFCREFAAAHGAKHAVFMANGTVSLQCALAACGVGAGDEVIVPAFTCTTCAMPIHNLGARPVFADVEPTTFCLDPVKAEAAISDRSRAIMPVHLYGALADMDAIIALAQRHDLIVLEDCAHVHGARWGTAGIGSLGHVGSFSFHQKKPMASGEGGICITNDAGIAERLHRLIHIGYAAGEYGTGAKSRPPIGLMCSNLSATEFQAIILRHQVARLGEQLAQYNRAVERLRFQIRGLSGVRIQSPGRLANPQSYNKLLLIFDGDPLRRVPVATLAKAIAAEGLPLGPTYGAVYQHEQFNIPVGEFVVPPEGCPVTETIGSARALVLNHPWLSLSEQAIDVVAAILAKMTDHVEDLIDVSRRNHECPSPPCAHSGP